MAAAIAVAAALHAAGLVAATGRERAPRAKATPTTVSVIATPATRPHVEPASPEAGARAVVGAPLRATAIASIRVGRAGGRSARSPAGPTAVMAAARTTGEPSLAERPAVAVGNDPAPVGTIGGDAMSAAPTAGAAARTAAAGGAGATTPATTGGGATAKPGTASDENEERTRRAIRARIMAHRRYPVLARRRRIEGTVTLSLAVRADGSVEAAVLRGADPMLDEAALDAVLSAAPLPVVHGKMEIDLDFRILDP